MNEILRFMQKRDERTDIRKVFYNLPTSAFGHRREIKMGSCGHVIAVFDLHSMCMRCCDRGFGTDPCVLKKNS